MWASTAQAAGRAGTTTATARTCQILQPCQSLQTSEWLAQNTALLPVGLSQKERGQGDRDKRVRAPGQLWVSLIHHVWISHGHRARVASLRTLRAGVMVWNDSKSRQN